MGPDEETSFFGHPMSYVAASALGGSQVSIPNQPYLYISLTYLEIIEKFDEFN